MKTCIKVLACQVPVEASTVDTQDAKVQAQHEASKEFGGEVEVMFVCEMAAVAYFAILK